MSDQLEVYVVKEYQVDYDDYPMGMGQVLFCTADLQRAKDATDWRKEQEWQKTHFANRTHRSYDTLIVEDFP